MPKLSFDTPSGAFNYLRPPLALPPPAEREPPPLRYEPDERYEEPELPEDWRYELPERDDCRAFDDPRDVDGCVYDPLLFCGRTVLPDDGTEGVVAVTPPRRAGLAELAPLRYALPRYMCES